MSTQTVLLGDTAVDIPSFLEWRDEDGTLVAYPPGTDYANLRFTLLSIKKKSGDYVPEAGVQNVLRRCKEANAALMNTGDKVWFYSLGEASEGTEGSVMHWWYVGMGAHILIISCFVEHKESDNPNTKRVLASVPATIASFRRAHDA